MVVIGTGNVMSHLRLTTNISCLCLRGTDEDPSVKWILGIEV